MQVMADVAGTVALERLLALGNALVGATASASRHPHFPSVVHLITVVASLTGIPVVGSGSRPRMPTP
jgi:hypothetical protein